MKKVLKKASPDANPKNLTIFEDPERGEAVTLAVTDEV